MQWNSIRKKCDAWVEAVAGDGETESLRIGDEDVAAEIVVAKPNTNNNLFMRFNKWINRRPISDHDYDVRWRCTRMSYVAWSGLMLLPLYRAQ